MKIRLLLTYVFTVLICVASAAQTDVSGVVVDKETDEALAGASVIIKSADGKIKKFATSDRNGKFAIEATSVSGCRLEVTMMGFAKTTVSLDSAAFPLTVYLAPGTIQLKEVAVKAERIREQGDTISYNVGSFAQKQDRSIGDVLKRMPGIDVAKNGKIQYQGEDINKFYIEGSDLLGGKYGVATNGISHDDVGAVEVMENHQPMQVLSGILHSDKAAINLKLKDKAKATWTCHGDAAGGYSQQPDGAVWDGEVFAMAVMPSFQNITTFRSNNTGKDLSSSSLDFFSKRRGTDLGHYVGIGLPAVPSLNSDRTLFNRSFLVSTNSLWKSGTGELKANIDYSMNRVTADASNVTTYFLDGGDRIVTENRAGKEHTHSLNGKFIYEQNRKTAFINNTLQADIDWNDASLNTTGSLPNKQTVELPDYYVANRFKMIKRFGGKHLVTFQSNNEWESLPQTLRLDRNDGQFAQHISDHAFHTLESASYAFALKGITLSLEGGVEAYLRSMNSQLNDMPQELPGLTENAVSTDYFKVYATPGLEYRLRRVNITLDLPLSYAHYAFDKAIANHNEVYFSPSLDLNWKPNNRVSGSLHGGIGRSPINPGLIYPGLVMTDYRTFKSGVDNFYNHTSQNISASIDYKHTRHGVFAHAMAMHSWTHVPYTLAQQLYGDYIVYSYADAKNDSKWFMLSGNLGKTIDFIRGSFNIKGSYSRNGSRMLSQENLINTKSSNWSAGGTISGSPTRCMSFDYSINLAESRLTMNGVDSPWLAQMTNEIGLTFTTYNKWELTVGGEHYRNEVAAGTFKNTVMLDTRVKYQLNKRVELGASLTNILNKRTYDYTVYSQLSSFESHRNLRGRQFLLSITIRK